MLTLFDPSHRAHRRQRPRRGILRATLLTVLLVAVGWLPAMSGDAQEMLNRVVIRVNDRISTLYDYQRRSQDLTSQIVNSELPLNERRERISQVPEQVYQEMFQELLLLSRADQAGIVYSDDELEQQKRRLWEQFGIQNDEQFRQALQMQNLNERTFQEQMETGMRIQELLGREVRSQIAIGEDLAREYYRDNPEEFTTPTRLNLRDIVVLEDGSLGAEEREERAAEIRRRRVAGEALEDLVEDGVTSGVIDLGWVNARELADELESAVWDLETGQVSEPVAGRGGLHVLEVVDRQEEGLRPFNEVAQAVEDRAGAIAFQEAMEEYIERLERESYVILDPPPAAANFRRLGTEAMPVPAAVGAASPASATEERVENAVSADGLEPEALTDLEEAGAQPLPDADTAPGVPDLASDPLGQDPSPADPPPPDFGNDGGNR